LGICSLRTWKSPRRIRSPRACASDRTRHLLSRHDSLCDGAAVQGIEERDPIERRKRICPGLCGSDQRMQFLPSGSQPRHGRNPCTEPDVRIGY